MGDIQDGSVVFTVRDKRAQALFDFVYPVGIVVALANDKKPAFMEYGTWEKVAEDRVLQGSSDSNAPGKKIDAGLPNIKGSFDPWKGFTFGDTALCTGALYIEQSTQHGNRADTYLKGMKILFDASKSNDIYGKSETVQPAAYVVAYWQRTA